MGVPVLPEWRPRRTLIDLYNEKDQTSWYYRVGATLSALMLAVGFLVFPSTFIQSYNSIVLPSSSLVGALVLIGLAHTISIILSFLTKSWLFQLDILYTPHLTSSALGLIGTVHALATHNGALSNALPSTHYAIAALALSITSILIYTILSLLTLRKIYIVRARDAMHRPSSSSKATGYLHEDEQQRKQLSRLLMQQEEGNVASPESATQSTFKIDWPGYNKGQSRRNSMSTMRYIPRFAGASRHGNRRSSMIGLPADHLTGGIERVPSVIREEPSRLPSRLVSSSRSSMFGPPADHLTGGIERVPTVVQNASPVSSMTRSAVSAPVSSMTQNAFSVGSGLPPLKPVAYVPPSQARYMGLESPIESATPQSALPSYRADAHPSMNISTRPLPRLEQNGFPVEKKEAAVYAMPASEEPRPTREGPYRMADPDSMTVSHFEKDTRFQMADRRPEGARSRPELDSEAMGPSGSIRIV